MTETAEMLSASLAYEKLKKSEAYQGIVRALVDCDLVYDQTWETPAERVLAGAIRGELRNLLTLANTVAADLAKKTSGLTSPLILEISND